jgi:hypothetical protein
MASIREMNKVIAEWLYGKGKASESGFWNTGKSLMIMNFDSNSSILMDAMSKIMNENYWYAVHPITQGEWEDSGKNRKFVKNRYYFCAFTSDNRGRLGYGKKITKVFFKKTPNLAMQYSIYRFIKNGLDY